MTWGSLFFKERGMSLFYGDHFTSLYRQIPPRMAHCGLFSRLEARHVIEQSNFNGSNTFGTMKISSRHG